MIKDECIHDYRQKKPKTVCSGEARARIFGKKTGEQLHGNEIFAIFAAPKKWRTLDVYDVFQSVKSFRKRLTA